MDRIGARAKPLGIACEAERAMNGAFSMATAQPWHGRDHRAIAKPIGGPR